MVTLAVFLFIVSGVLLVFGILSLLQKGYLFNNAYVSANEEERKKLNKKPYYIQTGIVFVLLSGFFLVEGFNALFRDRIYFYFAVSIIGLTIVFAIFSSFYIGKKNLIE